MKIFSRNIVSLFLIIIAFGFVSCGDVSKSCCEEILDFYYTENDSISEDRIDVARKCSEKYHKHPEFLQKISQIYYYEATNSDLPDIETTKKMYSALSNINAYFSKIKTIKPYDYQFRGEIYERLGDIYKDINSLKQATSLYDKALSDYEASNNNEKVLNILLKTGKFYQYNHMPNIAMIYFEMAEEMANIPNNIYRKIIDNKIVTFYELNDYDKADSVFKNHFNIKIQDYDFHSAIGTKLFYERNYNEAIPHLKYCFENGNQQEKLVFSEKLAESYFNTNDHENEMQYIQHQAKNNSLEIRRTPLKLDLEKLYDINDNIINAQIDSTNDNNAKYIIIIILAFSVVIISIFVTLIKGKKQDQEKIRSAQKTIDGNKEIIESKDRIIDDISKELKDLKTNESFEDAYKRFCESDICTKIRSSLEGVTILTKNVHVYSRLSLSSRSLIQIVKTFNSCFPNVSDAIKRDFPGISINDLRFIILIFMNLNDAEIAVLLGLTYGAANKRSNKIRNIFNIKDDFSSYLMTYFKSNF